MKYFLFVIAILFSSNTFSKKINSALVVSGGVSLGAYQSGFLSYTTRFVKQNYKPERIPRVFAGASAGSMNSLISIIEIGRVNPSKGAKDTFFWELWTPMKMEELADEDEMTTTNFLSKKPVKSLYKETYRVWKEGLREDFDITFGITVTQRSPEIIQVYKGGRKFPQMLNEAIFRIKGRGPGKYPLIENYIVKNNANKQIYLPFGSDQLENLKILLGVIEASGSFPLAFSPTQISYCKYEDYIKNKKCASNSIQTKWFIDGGLFNNVPLTIVNKVTRSKKKTGNLLLIVDPSDKHLLYKTDAKHTKTKGITGYAYKIFDNFIGTARSQEMISFYESPSFRQSLSSTVSMPLASTPMYAFFGFFERDFRQFDFLIGYADAKNFIKDYVNKNFKGLKYHYPNDITFNADENCVINIVEDKDFNNECLSRLKHNYKVLLRVSLAKMLENCTEINPTSICTQKEKLKSSKIFSEHYLDYRFLSNEDSTQYTLRKLKDDKFLFHELYDHGDGASKSDAPFLIVNEIHSAVNDYTKKLNTTEALLVRTAGKAYLDSLYYVPETSYLSLDLGSNTEFTYSRSFSQRSRDTKSWRWSIGIASNNLIEYQKEGRHLWAFIPTAGLEKTFLHWSGPTVQYHLGIKAGYLMAKNDRFGTESCDGFQGDFLACSGVYLKVYPLITLFERIRFKPIIQYTDSKKQSVMTGGFEFGFNF